MKKILSLVKVKNFDYYELQIQLVVKNDITVQMFASSLLIKSRLIVNSIIQFQLKMSLKKHKIKIKCTSTF